MRVAATRESTTSVPDRVAPASAIAGVGRRAAAWLRRRACGMGMANGNSIVICRDLTPEERAAREIRLARRAGR